MELSTVDDESFPTDRGASEKYQHDDGSTLPFSVFQDTIHHLSFPASLRTVNECNSVWKA